MRGASFLQFFIISLEPGLIVASLSLQSLPPDSGAIYPSPSLSISPPSTSQTSDRKNNFLPSAFHDSALYNPKKTFRSLVRMLRRVHDPSNKREFLSTINKTLRVLSDLYARLFADVAKQDKR